MNRDQIVVVVVAILGVLAFSGAATTIQTIVGDAGGGQDVVEIPMTTIKNTPTPISQRDLPSGGGGGGVPVASGSGDGDSAGSGSDTAADSLTIPTTLLGIIALALVVAAIIGIRTLSGRDRTDETTPEALPDEAESDDDEEVDEDTDEDDDAAAAIEDLGRSAGRAADQFEETDDPSNAVYRAWYEMTRHLDVPHPHASTPEEFADAAVAAGMDRTDVAALTEQFELVRYAGRETTSERVSTAETALRRIEDKYTTEES